MKRKRANVKYYYTSYYIACDIKELFYIIDGVIPTICSLRFRNHKRSEKVFFETQRPIYPKRTSCVLFYREEVGALAEYFSSDSELAFLQNRF